MSRDLVLAIAIASALVVGGGVLIATEGFGGDDRATGPTQPTPRPTRTPSLTPEPSASPTFSPSPEVTISIPPIEGAGPLTPSTVQASGQAPDVPRSNGVVDSYGPEQAVDGVNATAWCVPGDGSGQYLELSFPTAVIVSEVGIIPGYDKIDPQTGADRFKENRKVITVRYSFSDSPPHEVTTSQDVPLKALRQLITSALPQPVITTFVRIEPIGTTLPSRPDRDYTCISEAVVIGFDLG